MGALTGSTISSSYDMLLKTATTGGVTGTLKVIEDGLGIDSALKLSTTVVSVNGSLGVGVDAPSAELEILQSAGNAPELKITSGTVYTKIISDDVSGFSAIDYSHDLRFKDAGTETMRIDASGNCGIGTAAPSAKLDVEGSTGSFIRVSNASSGDISSGLEILNGTETAFQVFTNPTFGNTTLLSVDEFAFRTNDAERMRIDDSGNVGLGDTSPDNKLEIRAASTVGTVNGHIMLTGDGATNDEGPQIAFSESGASDNWIGGSIGFARVGGGGVGDLVFGTRGTTGDADTTTTERMRIDSSGNIGINTDSPTYKLDCRGSVLIKGDGEDLIIDSDDKNLFWIGNRSGGEPDKAYLSMKSGGGSPVIALDTGGDSYFNGGNIGINTDSPSQKLHVATGKICVDDGYNIGDTDADTGMYCNSDNLYFQTDGTARMTINSSGNVIVASIPTSDPAIAGALWSDSGTVKISAG